MTIISEHACAALVELGLSCQRVELQHGVEHLPALNTNRQWRLHVVTAGKRSLLSLIIIFCPFCGERLEETPRLPPTGVVLS